ncbi:MAG: protein-L-isoaspartate O-methyltransferase [Rhodocyclales bacterium GWA2_65_20]|nr:MAG: protein-L-isoaspartate O-methyltransferase [Rhodocyclales bacterium GWA2_65_20]
MLPIRRLLARIGWLALLLCCARPAAALDDMAQERRAMVEAVAAMAQAFERRAFDPRVLDTLGRVPRHEFVPAQLRADAYRNRPLPIGHGQTISQPYIVAAMTDLLQVRPGAAVLEIGTGSGYQAAVLAEMGCNVYSIEIVAPLAEAAAARLQRLGYQRVATRTGDGYHGWPERGPFDAIVVTAAADHVPPPLVRQLKPGGRMVIPVGPPFQTQQLMLVEKHADGTVATRQLMPVAFVPLTGSRR